VKLGSLSARAQDSFLCDDIALDFVPNIFKNTDFKAEYLDLERGWKGENETKV